MVDLYNPVPNVRPQGEIPRRSLDVPGAAFGENVAQAIEGFGKVAEGAGNEIFQRAIALQQVNNEAEAREADAKYMIAVGEKHSEFSALQGKAASDALPGYMQDLQKTRTDMRDQLSNPAAMKLFDAQSMSTMGRTIFNAAGHAASENKKYIVNAATAQLDADKDYTLQNPKDERAFQEGLTQVDTRIRGTVAPAGGWSKEQTDEQVYKAKSSLIAARISGLARTNPEEAKALLERDRTQIAEKDFERTDKAVQTQLRTTGARNISDEVNADLKSDPTGGKKPLQERLDEAQAKAEKIAPEDSIFQDYVRARVITDVNQAKRVKQDFDQNNKNTIYGSLNGNGMPDGKLPTTVEELTATPENLAAWNASDEKFHRSVLSALQKNAKDDVVMNQQRFNRWNELKGLSQTDPKAFLGVDITNEDLPRSTKKEFINQQLSMKNKAESDPRVTHALQVLRPMTTAAGVTPSDKEGYNQFVGSLQDAMDQFQKDNKKLPKASEINEMGARLLQQKAGTGWFGSNVSAVPLFQAPVPSAIANRIKLDPFWEEHGRVPTDADIQRIYTREQYQKLYGGAKSSEKPSVPRG